MIDSIVPIVRLIRLGRPSVGQPNPIIRINRLNRSNFSIPRFLSSSINDWFDWLDWSDWFDWSDWSDWGVRHSVSLIQSFGLIDLIGPIFRFLSSSILQFLNNWLIRSICRICVPGYWSPRRRHKRRPVRNGGWFRCMFLSLPYR